MVGELVPCVGNPDCHCLLTVGGEVRCTEREGSLGAESGAFCYGCDGETFCGRPCLPKTNPG